MCTSEIDFKDSDSCMCTELSATGEVWVQTYKREQFCEILTGRGWQNCKCFFLLLNISVI